MEVTESETSDGSSIQAASPGKHDRLSLTDAYCTNFLIICVQNFSQRSCKRTALEICRKNKERSMCVYLAILRERYSSSCVVGSIWYMYNI